MTNQNRPQVEEYFQYVRDHIILELTQIELAYAIERKIKPSQFDKKTWSRAGGGGGEMAIMHGNVFEKVGVNISTTYGEFSEEFSKEIKGTEKNKNFWASGVSFVAHPRSPLVPAAHFNSRYIETGQSWFGGGSDLTPTYIDPEESEKWHEVFQRACNKHNDKYHSTFRKQCDEYFYLKHRDEPRGIGGIFYDYLNEGNFDNDFAFTKDVSMAFLEIYPKIVKAKMSLAWNDAQRAYQLIKRGRYVEFNLLYDRGTKFGLMTGGNVEAIFMSLPPMVCWA